MISFRKGDKHKDDKKVIINGHHLTFPELAEICIQFVKNEDNIYPPNKGYRGGQMLVDYLNEAMGAREVTDDLNKRYRLGKYRPDKKTKPE